MNNETPCQAPSFIERNMYTLRQPLSPVAREGRPGTFPPYPEQHFLLTQTDPCWCLFVLIKPHRGRSSDTRLWLVCFVPFLVFLLPFSSVKSIWLYNFSMCVCKVKHASFKLLPYAELKLLELWSSDAHKAWAHSFIRTKRPRKNNFKAAVSCKIYFS